jgi:hypothetical protein
MLNDLLLERSKQQEQLTAAPVISKSQQLDMKQLITAPILLVCALSSFAAQTHYVSITTGSDSNPGTQSAPFRTLTKADSVAAPGDTVHVAAGSYGPITLKSAGTASARIRFVSGTKWGAQLGEAILAGAYTDLEGFDVVGGTSNVVLLLEASYTRALGNHVHNLPIACSGSNGGAGIDFEGGALNFTTQGQEAIGNLVEDIGSGPLDGSCRRVHGIYAAVPGGKIMNNIIRRAVGDGVTSWHAATNLTIVNNTAVDNGGNGVLVGSGDNGATSGNINSYVANNIVYHNALNGITESSDGVHKPANNRYVDNLLYDNRYNCISCSTYSKGGESGTINADPLFVDYTGGDYHLQSSSPAIHKGAAFDAPSTDFDGITRPGTAYDIGALEYSPASSNP